MSESVGDRGTSSSTTTSIAGEEVLVIISTASAVPLFQPGTTSLVSVSLMDTATLEDEGFTGVGLMTLIIGGSWVSKAPVERDNDSPRPERIGKEGLFLTETGTGIAEEGRAALRRPITGVIGRYPWTGRAPTLLVLRAERGGRGRSANVTRVPVEADLT
jgi:hypothetical protein